MSRFGLRPGREVVLIRRLLAPVVAMSGFAIVVLVGRLAGIPAAELTRDVTGVADLPPWFGILATAGVLAWAATAAVGLFSAWLLPPRSAGRGYLAWWGLIAAALAVDDQFRVTQIVHNLSAIPEVAFVAAYGALILVMLFRYRRVVVTTDVVVLGVTGALLGASVLMDVLSVRESLEDLLKVAGAATLLDYVSTTAKAAVRRRWAAAASSVAQGDHDREPR